MQYGDYSVWQREWLRGEALDNNSLTGSAVGRRARALELPTDHSRPRARGYNGRALLLRAADEQAAALRSLSGANGVTLF